MADKTSWEPLVQICERFFPSISPQIVPGAHHAKTVLQAIQSSLKNYLETCRTPEQVHCKWCGRVVSSGSDGTVVLVERILTWHLDWSKKMLKNIGAQYSCQECHLLLDLKRLLNFLLMLDESTDSTKLYSLAAHFCQVNRHTSQSGEEDVKLLQQAVSVAHSLHVLTKNVSDLEIQGPKGEIITLETVNELVERISTQDPSSLQNSTTKSERKKKKEGSSAQDANVTQLESSFTTNLKSNTKKKKKKTFHDSLMNGNHNGDREEVDGGNEVCKNTSKDQAREHLVLSEKRKKRTDGKVRTHGKKRRSFPVMKLE